MILLAKIGVGFMSAVMVGGAALCSQGFINVQVHEKRAGGTNLNLIVPGAAVPMALGFTPGRHLKQASEKLRPFLPALEAAIPALRDCPDGVLVEVQDPHEHVRIAKSGGSIVVDVNDEGETVHVLVPLRVVQSSVRELASVSGGSGETE